MSLCFVSCVWCFSRELQCSFRVSHEAARYTQTGNRPAERAERGTFQHVSLSDLPPRVCDARGGGAALLSTYAHT